MRQTARCCLFCIFWSGLVLGCLWGAVVGRGGWGTRAYACGLNGWQLAVKPNGKVNVQKAILNKVMAATGLAKRGRA
ncbi:MAG: hypothetical protein EAY75_16570 [Bacteroidetes bacterium]|nr:MAG: hypothetical protein EAY75_16570 [Bacteroidota bacterium]